MRVEKRDGYRVVVGGPVPPQADAITLGRTIFVRQSAAEQPGLMAHELVHVRQFRELGAARFLLRYLGSYVRFRLNAYGHMASYRRIPLEVEASWVSRLHDVAELEPAAQLESDARVLRTRLARSKRSRYSPSQRPRPRSGNWNRSNRSAVPALSEKIQTAMARREANA